MQQAVKVKREDVFIRWAPPCCFLTTCTFENPFWNVCMCKKQQRNPLKGDIHLWRQTIRRKKRAKNWWCIGVIMRWHRRRKGQKKSEKSLRHLWKPQKVPLYFYFSFIFSLSSNLKISLVSFHLSINIYLFWNLYVLKHHKSRFKRDHSGNHILSFFMRVKKVRIIKKTLIRIKNRTTEIDIPNNILPVRFHYLLWFNV